MVRVNRTRADFAKNFEVLIESYIASSRSMGDRSEDGDRGCGKPVEMGQDVFDDRRVFDARESLDRATTVLAGPDVGLEYPRQTLRLTLIETWRAGAGSLAVCALRRPRLAGVTCSRHQWFGAETP